MTTWKSEIMTGPDMYEEGYREWLEKVMDEPWARAVEDMVRWTGIWVGTEEELIAELKMRVGSEVAASPDFPSSLEILDWYFGIALDGFFLKSIGILDFRKLTEEDLEAFDVPGWGPEAPVIVYQGGAAHRPDYWGAMIRLLSYGDALPLAVLIFTGEDRTFRDSRKWTGTTTQLIDKLIQNTPELGPVPFYIANDFRPPEKHRFYHIVDYDPPDLLDPITREDYVLFHKRMRSWAKVLKEEKIGVSWERRDTLPGTNIKIDGPPKTYWTIEAPNWKKPDLLGID
jgi:hypothetical protein